jgi:predicted patatin/cPLA2 family phospholipase
MKNDNELDLAVSEFKKTSKAFEKAAKNIIAILDRMNKHKYQKSKEISGESKQIQDFLIQIMDDTGQIEEKYFGIKYEIDKDKNQNK